MKTSIIVQNLKSRNCAKTISSKLSDFRAISDLFVDVESATVSFIHKNLNDALLVKDKLKCLGFPSINRIKYEGVKVMSLVNCTIGKKSTLS